MTDLTAIPELETARDDSCSLPDELPVFATEDGAGRRRFVRHLGTGWAIVTCLWIAAVLIGALGFGSFPRLGVPSAAKHHRTAAPTGNTGRRRPARHVTPAHVPAAAPVSAAPAVTPVVRIAVPQRPSAQIPAVRRGLTHRRRTTRTSHRGTGRPAAPKSHRQLAATPSRPLARGRTRHPGVRTSVGRGRLPLRRGQSSSRVARP